MSESLIYLVNSTPQDVAIGGAIDFGNTIRRFGKNIRSTGTGIVTRGTGYYVTDITVDFTGSAGVTVFTVYENGTPVPGATVTRTTGAGAVYEVKIPTFVTRNTCCVEKTITVVVSGAEITDATISAVVEKA